MPSPLDLLRLPLLPLKRALAAEVRAIFDDGRGTPAVVRSADGLFGPGSMVWRVHGDVTTMMVGGVAALLLQMLHPAVLAGIWDHSNFRGDMLGRLRRTARFIAMTSYADRATAKSAMARVRRVHDHVAGVLPDGTAYRASDPALLAWVHATETLGFLDAYVRYADPTLSARDQDRYFAEMARIGEALGAAPVARTRAGAQAVIASMRGALVHDARTREVANLVLEPRANAKTAPLQHVTFQAAIDLLPPWARTLHGFDSPAIVRPLIRAGTFGIGRTLRWAMG